MKQKNIKNPPSNWIIFKILQRIIGFPFFLALCSIGVVFMLLKYIANYVVYGGEAIAYYHDSRPKMIHDVFLKVAEDKKDPNPELLNVLLEILPMAEDGYKLSCKNGVGEEGLKEDRELLRNVREIIKNNQNNGKLS